MDFHVLRDNVDSALLAMRRAWQWWITDLAQLIPDSMRIVTRKDDKPLCVEWCDGEIHSCDRAITETSDHDKQSEKSLLGSLLGLQDWNAKTSVRRVSVILPKRLALIRQLQFPSAARHDLRDIVALELDRQSPLNPDDICFDHKVVEWDQVNSQIVVSIRLLKKELIDEIVERCQSYNFLPVELIFDDQGVQDGSSPFTLDHSERWRRGLIKIVTPGLILLVALLSLATAQLFVSREQVALDQLLSKERSLKSVSEAVGKIAQQVKNTHARLEFLAKAKREPLFVATLADVTRYLPEDSWIFELERNGPEIRIRGYSPDASKLIAIFENAPQFEHAQFRSQLQQGQTKKLERFDLSFDLVGRN